MFKRFIPECAVDLGKGACVNLRKGESYSISGSALFVTIRLMYERTLFPYRVLYQHTDQFNKLSVRLLASAPLITIRTPCM